MLILGLLLLIRGQQFFGSIQAFFADILAMVSFICIVGSLTFMALHWLEFVPGISLNNNNLASAIAIITFAVTTCCFYIAIIYRVYVTFKNNVAYALSRLELKCFGLFVVWQFGLIMFVGLYDRHVTQLEATIVYAIFMFIDILMNFVLLYLFLKRLYRMILHLDESFQTLMDDMEQIRMDSMDDTISHPNNSSHSVESNQIMQNVKRNTMEQTEIVDMMAKISLLTIISEIFVHIWLTMVIIDINLKLYNYSWTYIVISSMMIDVGVFFNSFVLYATFPFNDSHYMKFCRICHNCLKGCCVIYAAKRSFQNRRG